MIRPRTLSIVFAVLLFGFGAKQSFSATHNQPGFDCFNPHTSVESAICGDAKLSKLYRQTEAAYARVQSNPAAFDIMISLIRSRHACITWKPKEPYKACIIKRQLIALYDYRKLALKPHRKSHHKKRS